MKRVTLLLAALLLAACDAPETRSNASPAQVVRDNENLQRRIEQMEQENKLREQYITDVTQTLSTVQDSLTSLRLAQGDLQKESKDLERQKQVTVTQRTELLERIDRLRLELESNASRLDEARQRAEKSAVKVAQLGQLMDRVQSELKARDQEISSLRDDVTRLQVEVSTRDETIRQQQASLAEKDLTLEERNQQMRDLELTRNRVYYRIAHVDELLEAKVIARKGGLFNSKFRGVWVPAAKIDPAGFTPADRRELASIPIDQPLGKVAVITAHDPSSYLMEADGPSKSILHIKDAEQFWSAGPFLIVGTTRGQR